MKRRTIFEICPLCEGVGRVVVSRLPWSGLVLETRVCSHCLGKKRVVAEIIDEGDTTEKDVVE